MCVWRISDVKTCLDVTTMTIMVWTNRAATETAIIAIWTHIYTECIKKHNPRFENKSKKTKTYSTGTFYTV